MIMSAQNRNIGISMMFRSLILTASRHFPAAERIFGIHSCLPVSSGGLRHLPDSAARMELEAGFLSSTQNGPLFHRRGPLRTTGAEAMRFSVQAFSSCRRA